MGAVAPRTEARGACPRGASGSAKSTFTSHSEKERVDDGSAEPCAQPPPCRRRATPDRLQPAARSSWSSRTADAVAISFWDALCRCVVIGWVRMVKEPGVRQGGGAGLPSRRAT